MTPRRFFRAALFSAVLSLPLLGAGECSDLTGTDSGSSSNSKDGTYTLQAANGKSLPYDMIFVDAQNKLVLTRGSWTVSGTKLETKMYTTSIIKGVSTSEARFNPERHTGTISVSGDRATATLDNGRQVTATISGGTLLTDDKGNLLKFVK